ncbi:MAG: hypothetical protein LKCHEGNO_02452 [Burkholderiaceae bacterium]|nr:hypothetical protein [Burkholderiaceae bacterium]
MVERLDEADAVEQRPLDAAVGQPAHGIDRAGDAAEAIALVEQGDHRRLVRNGQPQAVDVARLEGVAHEAAQFGRGHLCRHQHGVDAVATEQVVEHLGRAHLGHRIAEDQKDAGGAGDLHGEGARGSVAARVPRSLPDSGLFAQARSNRAPSALRKIRTFCGSRRPPGSKA